MTWRLSVSARKADFPDALAKAEPIHDADLSDAEQAQVKAVKALASDALGGYDADHGMVGLSASGGTGASGLLTVNLSVASEPEPPAALEPAEAESAATVTGPRWARGERPEAPGTVDHEAVRAQDEAEAADPTRAAYRPHEEPAEAPAQPTSLADDLRAKAEARKAPEPSEPKSRKGARSH
jgi:hypothetical protein